MKKKKIKNDWLFTTCYSLVYRECGKDYKKAKFYYENYYCVNLENKTYSNPTNPGFDINKYKALEFIDGTDLNVLNSLEFCLNKAHDTLKEYMAANNIEHPSDVKLETSSILNTTAIERNTLQQEFKKITGEIHLDTFMKIYRSRMIQLNQLW